MDARKREPEVGVLRARTFLAPGIPLELFELVTRYLGAALGCEVELEAEDRISGPMHGDSDPFDEKRADLGFLCSPSYLYLRAQAHPSVELVPAGFVFRDGRAAGRPVYFSEVVVRKDHPARRFVDLAGSVWGFNDECSLSGHFAALQTLSELGCNGEFFERRVRTGSHHASIDATLAGSIDAAAIDSVVLATLHRERPELEEHLRVLESWGPFPIQPIVLRRELAPSLREPIARAMLALAHDPRAEFAHELSRLGLEGCVPIDDRAYAEERQALCDLGQLPPSEHLATPPRCEKP